MYMKLVNLYGIKGRNAWYQKSGDGCFNFTPDRNRASYLTESECTELERNAEWYCKQFNAEKLVVDWEDTLLDRVIEGLKFCTPDVGCHDCPYYMDECCDSIAECEILKDARKLLEQYKVGMQNK